MSITVTTYAKIFWSNSKNLYSSTKRVPLNLSEGALVEMFAFAKLTLYLDCNPFLILVISIESLFLQRNVLSHESSFKKKPTQVYKKDTKV